MTLRYFAVENYNGDYFGEVCEEEFNPNCAFYHCDPCVQSMHPACLSMHQKETTPFYLDRGSLADPYNQDLSKTKMITNHDFAETKMALEYPRDEVVYDDEEELIMKQDFRCPCGCCGQEINFYHMYYYTCDRCDYSLHKLCAELPTTLRHEFHRDHALILSQVCPNINGDGDIIKMVSIHLLDQALTLHLQFIKTYGKAVAWDVYEAAILQRFCAINEDPMAELKNLKYETTVKEYQSPFEKLMNQVDITKSQAIIVFICCLPASIELKVRMFKPRSLTDAFSLAGLQEATIVALKQRNAPILTTPKTASGWNSNRSVTYPSKSTTTTLALPALNNQTVTKYPAGHKCVGQMFTLEITGQEEEECLEEEEEEESDMIAYELSNHTL
nr:B-box-type zinc finger, zinc finger, PHD-type, DC1 [Tanacetum cinerariifolium]